MTSAVARTATNSDHPMLEDYLAHVASLDLSDRALRGRLRKARALLEAQPDLTAWMQQPLDLRLQELHRTQAWPLVVFAIGTGRLRLDMPLMTAKNLTGLGQIVEREHPALFAAATEAGLRLGWTPGWVKTVLQECLAVLIAWHDGDPADLDADLLEEFAAALSSGAALPATSLRAYRTRLASLRRILFELQIVHDVPRRGRRGASLTDRFAAVPMAAQIRVSLLRYVTLRSAVLRPKSVSPSSTTCCRSRSSSTPNTPRCSTSPTCNGRTWRRSCSTTGPGSGAVGGPAAKAPAGPSRPPWCSPPC